MLDRQHGDLSISKLLQLVVSIVLAKDKQFVLIS